MGTETYESWEQRRIAQEDNHVEKEMYYMWKKRCIIYRKRGVLHMEKVMYYMWKKRDITYGKRAILHIKEEMYYI